MPKQAAATTIMYVTNRLIVRVCVRGARVINIFFSPLLSGGEHVFACNFFSERASIWVHPFELPSVVRACHLYIYMYTYSTRHRRKPIESERSSHIFGGK